jgi:hypothetical protein
VKKLVDMVDCNTEGLLIEFQGLRTLTGTELNGWFLKGDNDDKYTCEKCNLDQKKKAKCEDCYYPMSWD